MVCNISLMLSIDTVHHTAICLRQYRSLFKTYGTKTYSTIVVFFPFLKESPLLADFIATKSNQYVFTIVRTSFITSNNFNLHNISVLTRYWFSLGIHEALRVVVFHILLNFLYSHHSTSLFRCKSLTSHCLSVCLGEPKERGCVYLCVFVCVCGLFISLDVRHFFSGLWWWFLKSGHFQTELSTHRHDSSPDWP